MVERWRGDLVDTLVMSLCTLSRTVAWANLRRSFDPYSDRHPTFDYSRLTGRRRYSSSGRRSRAL